jgi:hypothetical protein
MHYITEKKINSLTFADDTINSSHKLQTKHLYKARTCISHSHKTLTIIISNKLHEKETGHGLTKQKNKNLVSFNLTTK